MYQYIKRNILILFLLLTSLSAVFAQRVPVVGIMTFDSAGSGISVTEAINLTNRVIEELNSWGTLRVVQGTGEAEFVIRGSFSRQGNNVILSASTSDAGGRVLNEYTEQARSAGEISASNVSAKAVERVPLPNYLLGTWQATINMPDGPVVCIMEFRTGGVVRVERYDTWEHRQNNSLRYEGFGEGNYFYRGFANRVITVSGNQVRVDAVVSINLKLEETLPDQTAVNASNLNLVFNADKTTFEIANGMLPCGRNFDGPSVYHSAVLGFSQFRKIR